MLVAVMDNHVLIINLASILGQEFISLLLIWSKKRDIVDLMRKDFNKELVMTKEDNENFERSTKCWICYNTFAEGDVKE